MAKGNTLKLIEGTVAGIALGVAATIFLSTKKGKEIKVNVIKSIEDITADFYKYISPRIKKIEKMWMDF